MFLYLIKKQDCFIHVYMKNVYPLKVKWLTFFVTYFLSSQKDPEVEGPMLPEPPEKLRPNRKNRLTIKMM